MIWELLILGLVIGSNNLAAALALGALGQEIRRGRILLTFGLFEFWVPLLGLWLGQKAAGSIADAAGWLGPTLLGLLGVWAVIAALRREEDQERLARRATNWSGLLLLAGGLSVDNLVVGFSLGLGERDPLLLAGTIACFSVLFTWLGLRFGDRARRGWRRTAEIAAGALLLCLAAAQALGWI